jgi:translocation and assembly module TamA
MGRLAGIGILAPHRLALISVVVASLATTVAWADEPKAGLQGVEDEALRDLIRAAIGRSDKPAQTRFEARRRGREAAETAIAVLRSEGFYGNQVTSELAEQDEDSEAAPRAIVRVEPGPQFRIARPAIDWQGEAPAPEIRSAGQLAMALRRGAPGRAADVLAAEGRIVSAIQQRGHADAEAGEREVIVDHADNTVQPTFRIIAGPLVRLDGLVIDNQGRTRNDWIEALRPWKAGEVYAPDSLAELERRLAETGAYDSVSVALGGPETTLADGTRPVRLTIIDRAPRTIEIGAGYSTSDGVGLDVRWTRYNNWRRADTRVIDLKLAEIQQRIDYRISLPHWLQPRQTLSFGAGVYNEITDAYDQTGAMVFVDVTRRTGLNSYATVGVQLDGGRVAEILKIGNVILRGQDRDLVNLSLLGAYAYDGSSDPLNPKSGWRWELRAEPTLTGGDADLAYLKVQGQVSFYFPFGEDERLVLATRARAGTIYGADAFDVPAGKRFYAGGGGSVRGYGYQAVGPRLGGTPLGGASLAEVSFEVRYDLTDQWGVVGFIDGGAVGTDEFPGGEDFSAGVGFGVRYDLGFGPIRADIAFPLDPRDDDPSFQIYISIGQAF